MKLMSIDFQTNFSDWCPEGISHEITLIWLSLDLTNDKSTLLQIMAWCQCWHTLCSHMASFGHIDYLSFLPSNYKPSTELLKQLHVYNQGLWHHMVSLCHSGIMWWPWCHMLSEILDEIISGNGLPPFRHQAIIWTTIHLLLIRPK